MAGLPTRGGAGAAGSGAQATSSRQSDIAALVAALPDLDLVGLALCWRNHLGGTVPAHLPRWLLIRVLGYRPQGATFGDLDRATLLKLKRESGGAEGAPSVARFVGRVPATREGADLRPGALLAREWRGKLEQVTALEQGLALNGKTYTSLSQVAKAITGTNWNAHRFFGLRSAAPLVDRPATSKSRRRQPSQVEAPDLEPLR